MARTGPALAEITLARPGPARLARVFLQLSYVNLRYQSNNKQAGCCARCVAAAVLLFVLAFSFVWLLMKSISNCKLISKVQTETETDITDSRWQWHATATSLLTIFIFNVIVVVQVTTHHHQYGQCLGFHVAPQVSHVVACATEHTLAVGFGRQDRVHTKCKCSM